MGKVLENVFVMMEFESHNKQVADENCHILCCYYIEWKCWVELPYHSQNKKAELTDFHGTAC
jgi:hypothetical protein